MLLQVEVRRMIGKACVIHVESQANNNHDYLVSIADLTKWEVDNGPFDDNCLLLIAVRYFISIGLLSLF